MEFWPQNPSSIVKAFSLTPPVHSAIMHPSQFSMSCGAVQLLWQYGKTLVGSSKKWCLRIYSDWAGFLEQLIEKLEGEELVEALLVVGSIWLRRNAVIFNNTFTPPVTVAMQAKSVLIDFLRVQNGGGWSRLLNPFFRLLNGRIPPRES
jgi:hypothetical protein